MKKFLGILLTMVLVLGTLTACGSAGNDKSDTSSKADSSSSAEVSSTLMLQRIMKAPTMLMAEMNRSSGP